jgi:hypothetical protein
MPANSRTSGARGRVVARVLLGVMAALTCLWSYAAPAQASSCAGVWVVVDDGALGGTSTVCAGSYSTGMTALRSVSTVVLDAGMVVKIDNIPSVANIQQNYWSYWHATRQADGSYSAWSYSSVGPSSYHPTPGEAEGWRYAPVGGGYVAPGVAPPHQTATTQAPGTTAAATTKRPTTAATKAATTAAGPTTTPAAPGTTTPESAPVSTRMETPVGTPSATGSVTDGAIAPAAKPTSTSTSSLIGGVIAIVAIGAAATGMLLWRKRVAARG